MPYFLILIFSAVFCGSTFAAQPLDKIIATVDTEVITQNELDARMAAWKNQMEMQGQAIPQGKENQQAIKKQMLDALVNERLQILAAERYGISVDEASIDQTVASIAQRNNMDLAQFREALAQENISYEKFRENLYKEMLLSRVQQRLVSSQIIVSDEEVDEFLKNSKHLVGSNQEYHLGHILLAMSENPSPDELKKTQKKAEDIIERLRGNAKFAEIATQYSDSGSALKGGDLGWEKAGELPTLFANVVPKMKVGEIAGPLRNSSGLHIVKLIDVRSSESKLEVQQAHARHILVQTNEIVSDDEAKTLLTELKKRIENGEDFAALARTYSEDPGSAKQGGDLDWVDANSNLDPKFFTIVQNTEPGQISDPFKTDFGWHLVKVEERRSQDQTEENQRQAARRMIQNSKSMEEMQTWLNQLHDESHIDIRDETLKDKEDDE